MLDILSPLINGVRYGWGEITIAIDGYPITDIVGIEYGEDVDKDYDYGSGNDVKGVIRGRNKPHAKIILNTEIVQMIRTVATPYGGRISSLPSFLIVVAYQPRVGLPLVTHKLIGCEFKKDEVKWKEGDKKHDQELEMMVRKILWV